MTTIAAIRQQFPQYADVSDRELVRGLHKAHYADMPYTDFLKRIDFNERIDPTKEMGFLDKFNAGMGKAFYDIGQGAAQLVGRGESGQETADRRALDRPLLNTGAGMAGNVAGNLAAFAPAAVMAPGAATVGGAVALSAAAGGLQPAVNPQERLVNMGRDAAIGGAVQTVAGPGARILGERASEREAAQRLRQSQNELRDATLTAARNEGYVVAPSSVNPSRLNVTLESIGGRAATTQEAALRNQQVTNDLARREAGLAPGQALSPGALEDARTAAAGPYQQVRNLPQQPLTSPPFASAAQTLDDLRQARFDANRNFRFYDVHPDPAVQDRAVGFARQAEMLENSLDAVAAQSGQPGLVDALRAARQRMAKTFDVERALNVGSGDASAHMFGRAVDRGAPVTGGLRTAGEFAEAFPQVTRNVSGMQAPGASNVSALAGAVLGTGGVAAAGPAGVVAGGLPLLRGPARSLVLSGPYQRMFANPDYSTGMLTRELAGLADEQTRRRLAELARAVSTPAAMSYEQGNQ